MFKVPEEYRETGNPQYPSSEGDLYGRFIIPKRIGAQVIKLLCMASDGDGSSEAPWEHVSISCKSYAMNELNRCPTWEEMCFIKDLFWDKEDTVVQFHPPESEYVSHHHYVLHLWRKKNENYETPPSILVGTKKGQNLP